MYKSKKTYTTKKEWSVAQLLNLMAKYCSTAEHCESEVREKLQKYEAKAEAIDLIVDYLREENYINDKRYCEAYMHDKVLYQGWGKKKIQLMLRQKQLPENEINAALQSFDATQYNQVLSDLIAKKRTQCTGSDFEIKAQITRFCLQRGFLYEEIVKILNADLQ